MMRVFRDSPRCKFLISFKIYKDKRGNLDEYYFMLEDYSVFGLHKEVVQMKMADETLITGIFLKYSVMEKAVLP
jgi:hypothetical protein